MGQISVTELDELAERTWHTDSLSPTQISILIDAMDSDEDFASGASDTADGVKLVRYIRQLAEDINDLANSLEA